MQWILELELIDHIKITLSLLLILIDWVIILSMPMMFKLVKTFSNKYIAKHAVVPEKNYLPEVYQTKGDPVADTKATEEPEQTLEDDLKRIRAEKAKKYGLIGIDDLRNMAKQLGQDGFKIKGYYKFDKPTLIEAIIQTEEFIEIEKAKDEASEAVDKAKDEVADEIMNDSD